MKVLAGQSEKADGHNQLSAKAKAWASKTKFPKARFIPGESQKLKPSINKEIGSIINEFRTASQEDVTIEDEEIPLTTEIQTTTFVSIEDLFTEESIVDALIRELRRDG